LQPKACQHHNFQTSKLLVSSIKLINVASDAADGKKNSLQPTTDNKQPTPAQPVNREPYQ